MRGVRARLTAITLLAFAGVALALTLLAAFVADRAMRGAIDADLKRRGLGFAAATSGPPDGGASRTPGPPGGAGPPDGGPPNGGPPGSGGPPGRSRGGGHRTEADWTAPAQISVRLEGQGRGVNSSVYDPTGFAAAARGQEAFTTAFVDGEPRRVFSVPVRQGGRVTSVVQVAYALSPALAQLDGLRWTLLLTVMPLGLLLGGLASVFIVGRLLRPLGHLNAEAVRIGQEGFGERLAAQGEDEFAALTGTLNGMIENLESLYRRERRANERLQEGMERQRRFTGDASHELKTPLSVFKLYLGVLKRSSKTVAEEAETVSAMERATDRMSGLVGDLLLLARSDSGIVGAREPLRLDQVLHDAILAVPGGRGRTVFPTTSNTVVVGDASELVRVFVNLIENALQHSGAAEPVVVDITSAGGIARVTVADRGAGIAPEHLPHLFERFYRADPSRASASGGNGLGLAICERIVQGHGGTITAESAVGRGTRFTVDLPLADPA